MIGVLGKDDKVANLKPLSDRVLIKARGGPLGTQQHSTQQLPVKDVAAFDGGACSSREELPLASTPLGWARAQQCPPSGTVALAARQRARALWALTCGWWIRAYVRAQSAKAATTSAGGVLLSTEATEKPTFGVVRASALPPGALRCPANQGKRRTGARSTPGAGAGVPSACTRSGGASRGKPWWAWAQHSGRPARPEGGRQGRQGPHGSGWQAVAVASGGSSSSGTRSLAGRFAARLWLACGGGRWWRWALADPSLHTSAQASSLARSLPVLREQVVAVGSGKKNEETGELQVPNVKVGQTVMYSKYSGVEFEVSGRCGAAGVVPHASGRPASQQRRERVGASGEGWGGRSAGVSCSWVWWCVAWCAGGGGELHRRA